MQSCPRRIALCWACWLESCPATPETYWDIQVGNPFAKEARQALEEGMKTFSSSLEDPDGAAFTGLIDRLRGLLGSELEPLARYCSELMSVPRTSKNPSM